jgi:putative SOS response-associated peptidase YedK
MCGRFTQMATWAEVHGFSKPIGVVPAASEIKASYNLAPTQSAAVLVHGPDALQGAFMQWGLISQAAHRPINARAETVRSSPLFKQAFAARRCVVPANGWYEWRLEAGTKQPYYFSAPHLLWFAGIYQHDSFAILTRPALAISESIHERSPVLLPTAAIAQWCAPGSLQENSPNASPEMLLENSPEILRATSAALLENLQDYCTAAPEPALTQALRVWPVRKVVNNVQVNDARLIDAIAKTQLF